MGTIQRLSVGVAAALSLGAPATADFVATAPNENNILAGTTAELAYSNALQIDEGTDFNGDPDIIFTQGNQITLTLSNGVFASLPTNTVTGGTATPTLNFVVNGGGVGTDFITFEIDNDNVEDDQTINFADIEVEAGSYSSTEGDEIRVTLSDAAGELTDNINTTNVDLNDNLVEVIFAFGDATEADFQPFSTTEIDVSAGAEAFVANPPADGPAFGSIGILEWNDRQAEDGSGTPVELVEADVTISGPFSAGIDEVYLRHLQLDGQCTASSGGNDFVATVVGGTATFPTLVRSDIDQSNGVVAPGDGLLSTDDYYICVTATGADVLLSGQYSGEAIIDTDASTTETFSGDIDNVQYANGEIFDVSYFFGDGGGYAAFLNVVTGSSAGPVIILSREDDGDLQSGLLDTQQDANTSVLYSAGDVDAALVANGGAAHYVDETTRGGLQIIVPSDSFVGSVILNPTNDLGSINTYQPRN